MNRRLEITQRQVRAICEGARKAGHVPVLRIGNVVIDLVPEDRYSPPQPSEPVDEVAEIKF
jgi:hypothetical protein